MQGTLPGFAYSTGMSSYLAAYGIRIFDYTKFAESLRDRIRSNAEKLATHNGHCQSCKYYPTELGRRAVITEPQTARSLHLAAALRASADNRDLRLIADRWRLTANETALSSLRD